MSDMPITAADTGMPIISGRRSRGWWKDVVKPRFQLQIKCHKGMGWNEHLPRIDENSADAELVDAANAVIAERKMDVGRIATVKIVDRFAHPSVTPKDITDLVV